MLVRETPAEPDAVERVAADAGWALPRSLAVLAISGPQRETAASRLPAGTIREAIGELMCAVVSDPDGPGQRGAIEQAIAAVGARAGLGSTVDWSQAHASFVRAQAALELVARDGELITARDYAGQLLLRSDPGLADELAADRLAPLDDLSPGSRRRLHETLEVWLAEQGRVGAVAERLGIHPQTARYRVGRLRDLFGDALDEPDARFWLEVALRVGDAEVS
ncbi:MAG: PucR family transcriptional regulator [Solirubrobacteraceae bacterium]